MKSKRVLKILGIVLAAGLLLQTGILAYANVFGGDSSDDIDTSSVVISQEVLDLIKQQDPEDYSRNINNYKRMIVILNVHDTFKVEIEDLVRQGTSITDLMIAYTFLNDCYGTINELEELISEKESGKNWVDILVQYNSNNSAFQPRSFDFDYLENLTKTEGITADDIMTADRVSQKTGKAFEEVIELKTENRTWKDINAELGVVNGQETMPRVPVTPEQLKKYTSGGELSEERVVETLVTAFKLGFDEEEAIGRAKEGYTTEMFFAEALEGKYY